MHEVTAKIPDAKSYNHIHFGIWASLGTSEKDGSQMVDGLGIGLVRNFSDEGLTGDGMPNNKSGTYEGNWVAAIRGTNDEIALEYGEAMFGKGEVTAKLTNFHDPCPSSLGAQNIMKLI